MRLILTCFSKNQAMSFSNTSGPTSMSSKNHIPFCVENNTFLFKLISNMDSHQIVFSQPKEQYSLHADYFLRKQEVYVPQYEKLHISLLLLLLQHNAKHIYSQLFKANAVNRFHDIRLFLSSLTTSKNQRFPDVFWGYKKDQLQ